MKGFILKQHEAQALAAGKPVVIWRMLNPQPKRPECAPVHRASGNWGVTYIRDGVRVAGEVWVSPFPVGVPLFGKETWALCGAFNRTPKLNAEWAEHQVKEGLLWFKADNPPVMPKNATAGEGLNGLGKWRSSTSMPEVFSRITLTLSNVKVRRPCDVTGEEACDMLTEECRAKAPYMETKGVLADWHIRAFRKQFSLHYKSDDWDLYHFTALATPQPKDS